MAGKRQQSKRLRPMKKARAKKPPKAKRKPDAVLLGRYR